MDAQRNLFLIALLFVTFLLWQAWQTDNSPQSTAQTTQQTTALSTSDITTSSANVANGQSRFITVDTDVLSLTINTQGGDIEQAKLLAYPETLSSSNAFVLLETTPEFVYQAQSGLIGVDGSDRHARAQYLAAQTHFQLSAGQDELRIPLTYVNDKTGAVYTKTFVLKRGQYDIKIDYTIDNKADRPLSLLMYGQLKQTITLPKHRDTGSSNFALQTFRGAAVSSSQDKYKKYNFSDIKGEKTAEHLNLITQGGWVAMLQQYFATAWIPNGEQKNTFYTNYLPGDTVVIGFKGEPVIIEPGDQQTLSATLWVGPELQKEMAAIAPHLDLTVDYGWLWFISQPLFKLLQWLNSFIHNWGYSIIVITFIVRGVMYPLTKAQYTSMAKMRMLQPKIQAMRERVGDDRQRMSQEMMALYKEEKVNPLGGCLPLIIQMPIFLALYYMLIGSVELRHAPFMLWIHDLSAQDPYYILPLLMGLTMFIIQKMSPTTVADPMQQKIMNYMPVIFTVFFLWFPSGLVVYYVVSNLVTIIQQQVIYRSLEKRGLHSRDKK